jgi:hypothetical protein
LEEILAIALLFANILIKEDFPTFDRPINAYSGNDGGGAFLQSTSLCKNVILLIITH